MKKFMKIGALSLALIASMVMLTKVTNTVSAFGTGGKVSLEITAVSGTCEYGTSLYIGTSGSQYLTHNMTGSNFTEKFECKDTEGLSGWTMTMQASSVLSNGTVAQDIPAANVNLIVNNQQVVADGHCDLGTTDTTWNTDIAGDVGFILNKSGVTNDICTLSASGVNLSVVIPANQAVGLYTGSLTLSMPF